jgi:hypothetical protein
MLLYKYGCGAWQLLNETVARSGRGGNISSDVNFVVRKRDEKKINGLYTNRRLHQRDRKDREANLVFMFIKEFHLKQDLKWYFATAACTSYYRQFLLTPLSSVDAKVPCKARAMLLKRPCVFIEIL